ncbi:aldehyde dehydrogenase family protein [Metallibacterium sp.]|uniref:aldehyde dehydrogenase family protein n=1 Tax=Metallibacterium sp. TaxID=2940281 RepID=UPI002613FB11|nr:aldehyde dehydrogenase family protein [Metallibacterium sp.]
MSHMMIPKTYKLYINGTFVRSESGRSYQVFDKNHVFVANVAMASRKDARDAVVAARSAFSSWSGASAYNRGQVLYRIAEILEGRREQFIAEILQAEGGGRANAALQVNETIDTWVWYAGWADKYAQVAGNTNPVTGPYFNLSVTEPTGVVSVIAPKRPSLLGFASAVAPVLVSGNTVVVIASQPHPLPALSLSEVLATSDIPKGAVNILSGNPAEISPWLASHADINAIYLIGAGDLNWADLQASAAETLKRVVPPEADNDIASRSLERILAFTEIKTVWHTKSLS